MTLFFEIEKQFVFNKYKNINYEALEFEFKFYSEGYNYDPELFNLISKIIYEEIKKDKNIFKLENNYLKNILKICTFMLNTLNKEICVNKFCADILTNWVISSFLIKVFEMSYETQNFTYLSRYHLIDNIILLMSKFFIFFDELNLDINENDKKLKFFVVQLIVLLCEKKGLNKTSLNHFFNNTKKTLIFVGIKKRKNYNYLYNLNIYLNKPNLIKNNEKTFFLGYHYFSINFVFKKNIKSGKIFYLNDYDILEKLKTLEYKIDFELYELFLNEISMELNTKKEMLKDVIHKKIYEILNSKNLVLDLLNKNYFLEKKFKPILEELTTIYDDQTFPWSFDDLLDNSFDIPENISNNYYEQILCSKDLDDDIFFKKDIFHSYILNIHNKNLNILNRYYIYLIFLSIKELLANKNSFYLSYSFDFRGRLYSNSYISPIGDKLFRFIYNYGFYSHNELQNYNFITSEKILNFLKNSNLYKYNIFINLANKIHINFTKICLFELGKLFKSDLIKELNGIVSEIDFLKKGDSIYTLFITNKLNLNFYLKIEILKILNILNDLKTNIYKKHIIYKDSTASGIQLLTVILGAANINVLNICNLNIKDKWYDTYFHIIEMFKQTEEIKQLFITENNLIEKLLTRKILKKITMVYSYNVSFLQGKKYYLESVQENIKDIKNLDIELKISSLVFFLYFKFLNNIFKEEKFYKISLKSFIQKYKEKLKITGTIKTKTYDNCIVDFVYFYPLILKLDRTYKKKRTRIQLNYISNDIDELKTLRALVANFTHAVDATFVREILKRLDKPIITIHDCFGIDILKVDYLIEEANFVMFKLDLWANEFNLHKLEKKELYYSDFILL